MKYIGFKDITDAVISRLRNLATTERVYTFPDADVTIFGTENLVGPETPSGILNGINTAFTLSFTPAGGLQIFKNGLLQDVGDDFTITGVTITMATAPVSTDKLRAYYRK